MNWLDNARAVARRYQDPCLSALLVAQVVLIFVAEPLAFEGFEPPLIATGIVVAGLIILLALGSDQLGALIIVAVAGSVRLLTAPPISSGARRWLWPQKGLAPCLACSP